MKSADLSSKLDAAEMREECATAAADNDAVASLKALGETPSTSAIANALKSMTDTYDASIAAPLAQDAAGQKLTMALGITQVSCPTCGRVNPMTKCTTGRYHIDLV